MTSPRWRTDAATLLLRLVLGVILAAHGAQKVFEFTPAGTAASFAQMGVPLASVAGPAVAWFELIGGALLVLGLATRLVALLAAADMVGALVLVHLSSGLFSSNGDYEQVLILAAAGVALALLGAGTWSLDAVASRLNRSRRGARRAVRA